MIGTDLECSILRIVKVTACILLPDKKQLLNLRHRMTVLCFMNSK